MTIWDNIYKQFQHGGKAWASLSKGIDPRFIAFIKKEKFPIKQALDIGCGTGKYIVFLEKSGFAVDGIDSSPTAVKITQKNISSKSHAEVADMFTFCYLKEKYDLILSIATLQHGYKEQIAHVIKSIY